MHTKAAQTPSQCALTSSELLTEIIDTTFRIRLETISHKSIRRVLIFRINEKSIRYFFCHYFEVKNIFRKKFKFRKIIFIINSVPLSVPSRPLTPRQLRRAHAVPPPPHGGATGKLQKECSQSVLCSRASQVLRQEPSVSSKKNAKKILRKIFFFGTKQQRKIIGEYFCGSNGFLRFFFTHFSVFVTCFETNRKENKFFP